MYYQPKSSSMATQTDVELGFYPEKDHNPHLSFLSLLHRRRLFRPLLFCVGVLLLFLVLSPFLSSPSKELYESQGNYMKYDSSSQRYRFYVVTDMDKLSQGETGKEWVAYLKEGSLERTEHGKYQVTWNQQEKFSTAYNEGGRGMELSELVYFDGKLLACDDRTGIVFEILLGEKIVVPRHIFTGGNGNVEKGFKCEWMTVVNDKLYVGSIGKEFVRDGKVENFDSQWIKIIDKSGVIQHVSWRDKFEKLRKKSDTEYPGYLVHESIMWDPTNSRWVVFPRRLSTEPYDESLDEEKGTNVVFLADKNFDQIEMKTIGTKDDEKGTSSLKFIPHRDGEAVQLKTIEHGDKIESYITVVNINTGEILMPDTLVDKKKYEGIEIV